MDGAVDVPCSRNNSGGHWCVPKDFQRLLHPPPRSKYLQLNRLVRRVPNSRPPELP